MYRVYFKPMDVEATCEEDALEQVRQYVPVMAIDCKGSPAPMPEKVTAIIKPK